MKAAKWLARVGIDRYKNYPRKEIPDEKSAQYENSEVRKNSEHDIGKARNLGVFALVKVFKMFARFGNAFERLFVFARAIGNGTSVIRSA